MNEISNLSYVIGFSLTIIFLVFYIRWQTKKYKNSDNPMDMARKFESYIILFFSALLLIFFLMKLIGGLE